MMILSYLPQLLSGISVTLMLMIVSLGIGLILAVMMTLCHTSRYYLLRKLIDTVIFFVRGTPLLVQIFLIYYGSGQFSFIRESSWWFIFREPTACAIIALAINTACYSTVLLIGALHAVPYNEIDACKALGMSNYQAMRRVIFPRAFRIALPAYSNEILMVLKATSLASTITLLDVMGITQQLISQ